MSAISNKAGGAVEPAHRPAVGVPRKKRQQMQKTGRLPVLCGFIDASVIFVAGLMFAAVGGKPPQIVIFSNPGLFFGILLPLCVFVGWRGLADTKRLIAGHRGWLRPGIEGFLVGFLPVPLGHVVGIVNEAIAAGPPWPPLGYSTFSDWIQYLLWLFTGASIFGGLGAAAGLILSGINRLLIRCLDRN